VHKGLATSFTKKFIFILIDEIMEIGIKELEIG